VSLGDDGKIEHPHLEDAPRLSLWRALTDNDKAVPLDKRFVRSGFFSLTRTAVTVEAIDAGAVVHTTYRTAFGDTVLHRSTIRSGAPGQFLFDEHVELPDDTTDGLRVGIEFTLIPGYDEARWVGLGPHENYPDRRSAARLGAWSSPIDELAVQYMPPQENGGRGEVTELELSGTAGTVTTRHETPLQVNVGRHTVDELEAAPHWWELTPSAATVVHLDVAHRGLGTGVLGPDTDPRFRLDGTSYSWRWELVLPSTPSAPHDHTKE